MRAAVLRVDFDGEPAGAPQDVALLGGEARRYRPASCERRPASWSQTASEECTEPVTMSSGMPNCGAKKRECAADVGSTVSSDTRQ